MDRQNQGYVRKEIGNQLLDLMHQLLGPRLMFRVPDTKVVEEYDL